MSREPMFLNIDQFSKPLKSKPTSIPPHVDREKRAAMERAAQRKPKKSKNTIEGMKDD